MTNVPRALRTLAFCAAAAAGVTGAPVARAQSNGSKVTAEALFVEGRRLVAAGQYAEACPKFADSQRLDPSVATLLNLGNCYEKVGRTATAWATYREAASAANAAGRRDFVATAERHAEILVPHLSRLTLTVAQPAESIEIKRDGLLVERPEWGTPIPVDPGPHTLAASAPGRKPWTATVDIGRDGAQVTAAVPALDVLSPEEAAAAAPAPPPATSASTASTAPPSAATSSVTSRAPAAPHGDPGSSQRTIGWIVGGAGVASVLVGGGFAIAAKARYDQSLGYCRQTNVCSGAGVAARNDALTRGDVATWTMTAGAVAAAAGLVVVLTAPHAKHDAAGSTWSVAPALGGLQLRGEW